MLTKCIFLQKNLCNSKIYCNFAADFRVYTHVQYMIMKVTAKYFVFWMTIVMSSVVMAQTQTRVPYSMGFEDSESAELSNWVLNPGTAASACMDQWTVGGATHSSGSKALYISADGGVSAEFGYQKDVQYVYRDFYLAKGNYDFSFDWKNIGSAGSYMAVGYGDPTKTPLSNQLKASSTSSVINALVKAKCPSQYKQMYGADVWQSGIFSISSDGQTPVRVFFVWANGNTDSAACTMGACIDNIQITSQACSRPTELAASVLSCDSVKVTWDPGVSEAAECYYRKVGTDLWQPANQVYVSAGSAWCYLDEMSEGSYDIRVRGICTPDTSAWTYKTGVVIYCPEMHCVNFTMLDDTARVTCYYGDDYNGYSVNPECAYAHIGIKDYGSDDKRSRHTVNWDITATDPRTGNALTLIPADSYASVRLGNWEYGAEAEAISYKFAVDSDYSILLMKYAVVLEDPSHTEDEQPRFVLDILDEFGNLVNPTCGHCNFAADASKAGWHTYGEGYDMVTWKDWTTIGLHLEDYVGQTLTVRLTTYDCSQSGHYGYAYFTLDCASATIETKACAKDTVADMTLKAPSGFKYQWYDKYGFALPGETNAEFTAPDTATYRCRLTSTEEAECYFDLYSQCIPRLPVPEFVAKYDPVNCTNRVTMINNTYVATVHQQDTMRLQDDYCDAYLWETKDNNGFYKSSDHKSPSFVYPEEGGEFTIQLTAYLNGGCEETTTQTIVLPKIGNYDAGHIDTVICEGESVDWGDTIIATSGFYRVHAYTFAGCDSIASINVTVAPRTVQQWDSTLVCYGENHYIGDSALYCTKSQMHIVHFESMNGCDSIIMQYVTVPDPILPVIKIDSINPLKQKYTAEIYVSGTGFTHFILQYTQAGGVVSKTYQYGDTITGLEVNYYTLIFRNEFDCADTTHVMVGGTCLKMQLQEQLQCDNQKPVIIYPFVVDSGLVTTYDIQFSEAAKLAGFKDVSKQYATGNEIVVDIPSGAEPGLYDATIVFTDIVCGDKSFDVQMMYTYPASMIYHRWDDVISIKNAETMGYSDSYQFYEFQWYLDGAPIDGATQSYFNQLGGLKMDGKYQMKMRRIDGVEFMSCAYVPKEHAQAKARAMVSPTATRPTSPITVQCASDAVVEIYSMQGQKIATQSVQQGVNTILSPALTGVYIMNVRASDGTTTVRLSIQ